MNEADAALRVAGRRGGRWRAAVLAIVVTFCGLLTAALISLVVVGYQWWTAVDSVRATPSQVVGVWVNEYGTRIELRADGTFTTSRIEWLEGFTDSVELEWPGAGTWALGEQPRGYELPPWQGITLTFGDDHDRQMRFLVTERADRQGVRLVIRSGDDDSPGRTPFERVDP